MNEKPSKGTGEKIGDIFRTAIRDGDLSRLGDIGPVVQDAVQNIPGVKMQEKNTRPTKSPEQPKPAPQSTPDRPAWQGSAAPQKKQVGNAGMLPMVLGALGMVGFGIAALILGLLALVPGIGAWLGPVAGAMLVLFGACGGVVVAGYRRRQFAKRVRAYCALFAAKDVWTVKEIAAEKSWPPEKIKKDIKKALDKQMLPDVRMDIDETCVMHGEEAYGQYLAAEKARRQREDDAAERDRRLSDPATAGLEHFRQEGEAALQKIGTANVAIASSEVSEKLDKLEDVTAKIFGYVAKHPQKLPATRKFMSYYLPTTLKLVEKYSQYEEMEVQAANVVEAKEEINSALDTIGSAFNNLLESLYQEDTLDVSTDIKVLETMLEQEGLTGKQFTIEADSQEPISLK